MVCYVHQGIRVQSRVDHDAINEVFDDCGNAVDVAEAIVKCGGLWHRIKFYKFGLIFHGIWRTSAGNAPTGMSELA